MTTNLFKTAIQSACKMSLCRLFQVDENI